MKYLALAATLSLFCPHGFAAPNRGLGSSYYFKSERKKIRDKFQIQSDFVRRIEENYVDHLPTDCEMMLMDIFGGVRSMPQFSVAISVLDPRREVVTKAISNLRAKTSLNRWDMEAVSLIVLRGHHWETTIPLIETQASFEPGEEFWANMARALNVEKGREHVPFFTLRFLNSRLDLVEQAPAAIYHQVADVVSGRVESLEDASNSTRKKTLQIQDEVHWRRRDMHDRDSSSHYRSRMEISHWEDLEREAVEIENRLTIKVATARERDRFMQAWESRRDSAHSRR